MASESRTIIDIGQPEGWFSHYRLDENHFKRGEKLREGIYQSTDLAAYLHKMEIPSDLTKIIDGEDFLPFEEATPKPIPRHPNYPDSRDPNVTFPIKPNTRDGAYSIVLYWISTFNEWVALRQGREKCPFCDFEGERYKEVGLLNDYCTRKLLEAYEVPEGGSISSEDAKHANPYKLRLARLTAEGNKVIILNFGPSDYARYAPGVPYEDDIVVFPVIGEFPIIGSEVHTDNKMHRNWIDAKESWAGGVYTFTHYDKFKEVQPERKTILGFPSVNVGLNVKGDFEELLLLWIQERDEWVAVCHSNWNEEGGLRDDSYHGPFALDDFCKTKVFEAYKVSPDKVGLVDAHKLSPSKLEEIFQQI